ncbi:Thymidylate synthase, partial [Lemmus lemmus]
MCMCSPDNSTDYSGQGVDQLQKVIDTIRTNSDDRRIIMCAWNPKGRQHPSHLPLAKLARLLIREMSRNEAIISLSIHKHGT